jgi:hypothetical protein
MKLLTIFGLLSVMQTYFLFSLSSIIETKKICKDCKFFIANKKECRKFKNIDLITGKKTYISARIVRNDDNKCGENGILYEKNNFTFLTEPYYWIKEEFLLVSFVLVTILYISLNVYVYIYININK